MGRAAPDFDYAAERAKVEGERRTRRDEIDVSYRDHVEVLDVIDAQPGGWAYATAHAAARGEVIATRHQALVERNRLLREVDEDCDRRQHALDERARFVAGLDMEKIGLPGEELPPPPDDADEMEPELSGRPLPKLAVLAALRLFALRLSERAVEEELKKSGHKLAWRGVRRVWSWHASGAARWDLEQGKVIVEPGYRFVGSGPPEWRMVRLVRFGPVRSGSGPV